MANSPAKRHYLRTMAAVESARHAPNTLMTGASAYEQQMMQLQQDRLRLKQIQSEEGKAELKRQLLPAYADYVKGVLDAGQGAQDEVVTMIMVWCMDAGYFSEALKIAAYVLKHKLTMPDRFQRTTGCLIAEEIAEAALRVRTGGDPVDIGTLLWADELTADQDMPDQVRAKLQLALGRALAGTNDEAPPTIDDLTQAVAHLKRAIELNSSCGGKKDLERAERLLKKQAANGS